MTINRHPPESRRGICAVCGGNIEEKFHEEQDLNTVVYGIVRGFTWKSSGLHCTSCGIKYEFVSDELP